jgi:hypothetical protein
MNTLVFHSSSLGVTEHSREATGMAGDLECTEDALLTVQGVLDEAAPYVASFGIGINAEASRLMKFPDRAYIQADGDAQLVCQVLTTGAAYSYPENLRRGRNRRFVFGRGIRDPYLGYVWSNPAGGAFLIDEIEFGNRESEQRKV